MLFPTEERRALLQCKGEGPTVIARLEAMGYASLAKRADASAQDILEAGARMTGSTCWKNSPPARAAINAVLDLAHPPHG